MPLTTTDRQFITDKSIDPSAICELYYTPRLVTGMVIDTLRQFYASPELIEEPALRDTVFRNADNTGVLIQELTDWRPQNTSKRPAIIIARGDVRKPPEKRAIGNSIQTGKDQFACIFQGDITANCIANTGAQAELLATDVYKNLLYFSTFYKSQLKLGWWELSQIGKISKLEEAQEHFCVPITMEYGYYDIWEIKPNRIPIREVNISAYVN